MTYTHTILLIEDDADDAEMTLYMLGKLNGFHFIHIDDGVKALEYLFSARTTLPSLILLDLKMPKVDGIEILGKVKAHATLRNIPVIALISSKDGIRYVESFQVRADGYLIKPIDCNNFIGVLSEIGLNRLAMHSQSDISRQSI
jgi:two-component system, response regulator